MESVAIVGNTGIVVGAAAAVDEHPGFICSSIGHVISVHFRFYQKATGIVRCGQAANFF
jgi:hypothetical protein